MTDETLRRLGDALERAAEHDLAATRRPARRRLRIGLVAAAVLVLGAGTAVASGVLFSDDEREVAASLPAGAAIFEGIEPACRAVDEVVFDCTLPSAPAPEVTDFTGTIEPIVDATKHVSGACVGQASDGLRWRCYLGEEAVRRELISADFLGEYAPTPGRG